MRLIKGWGIDIHNNRKSEVTGYLEVSVET